MYSVLNETTNFVLKTISSHGGIDLSCAWESVSMLIEAGSGGTARLGG